MQPEHFDLDLGDGHYLRYFRWEPDDLPANRELYGVPLPVVEKAGATVYHGDCASAVHFDLPEIRKFFGERHVWQVVSWDPLTLTPSLLCMRCGDHGFVRDGKWVRA